MKRKNCTCGKSGSVPSFWLRYYHVYTRRGFSVGKDVRVRITTTSVGELEKVSFPESGMRVEISVRFDQPRYTLRSVQSCQTGDGLFREAINPVCLTYRYDFYDLKELDEDDNEQKPVRFENLLLCNYTQGVGCQKEMKKIGYDLC